MMLYSVFPSDEEFARLSARATLDVGSLRSVVSGVLADVCERGDAAVRDYGERFDGVRVGDLLVSQGEFDDAWARTDVGLKDALRRAYDNIVCFHRAQRFDDLSVDVCRGVRCVQRSVAINSVGLYVPGGTAPLFSTVLMLAGPARVAGCRQVVLCTPPLKDGSVHPAVLCAARICGVGCVVKAGGVQAIGSMAYGTESVPRVSKIFGPGNQYVVAAKQLVSLDGVAIDMPAGPSEVEVLADGGADERLVAADLLSQAEHGVDSQALLITTDRGLAERVEKEVERMLADLPRRGIAERSLSHSAIVVVESLERALVLTNRYAPEHLIIQTRDYVDVAARVENAGSVFMGAFTPESAGDYASGTNHTLPTCGCAVAYSGVNLDSFCRKMTLQELSPEGVSEIGGVVELMASAEGLEGHRRAMALRRELVEGGGVL